MRKLARSLIRLYPANWRARYGEEFEALLEDSDPGWAGVFDLLKGAVTMQFNARSFSKLAGWLAVAGMLAGLAISFIVTPRYVSQAEMRLIPALGSKAQPDLAEMLQQYQQELLSRTSLSRIIQDPRLDLYKNERAHVPFEDVIERMRSEDIRIRVDAPRVHPEKLAFNISFAYEDPLKAQQTVQALITGFEDANLNTQEALQPRDHVPDQVDRMEARIAALEKKLGMTPPPAETGDRFGVARTGVNLDVLDPPSLPVKPIAPNRAAFMFAGFGGGFACAVLIAVFRRPAPPLPFPAQTA